MRADWLTPALRPLKPFIQAKNRPLAGSSEHRGGRTRTCNPRFWRPVLCQLSYAPRFERGLYPRIPGHSGRMTDMYEDERDDDREDDPLEDPEGQGLDEDEAEGEEAFEEDE